MSSPTPALALAALAFGVLVAGCAPARLERAAPKPELPSQRDENLTRALAGANDEDALRSLGRWLETAPREGTTVDSFTIRFHPGGSGIYGPYHFDRLEAADRYDVDGLPHHHGSGIGVAMVGYRKNRQREARERWYSPDLITRAVTAVAMPGPVKDGRQEVEIRLYDRLQTETLPVAGRKQALAWDFSVPWAAQLQKERPLEDLGFFSAFRWRSPLPARFVLMEEYDPRRTPVICIHGLFSTSLAWAELTNELWADPVIRRRYQVWHYLYPTNAPALYSGMIMRRQLDELRKALDPEGNDPAMRRSVVVSHSLGGLLAKSLVVRPSDAFWNAYFTKPIDALTLTATEREILEDAFRWEPRAHVDRVIFCSVPFKGSTWASSWVGRLGTKLVVEENRFQGFFRAIERKNPGLLRPEYRSLADRKVTSVAELSPEEKSTAVFGSLPLVPGTSAHVIAGAHDKVVPPASARVPGAESFIKVPSGHGSFDDPKAIAEIRRILALSAAR